MAETKTKFPKYTPVQVRTPLAVARFPSVHEPDSYMGAAPKFKLTLVFEGGTDLAALTEGALKVASQVYPTRKADKVNVIIKDGDEQEKDGKPIEELRGKTLVSASCGKDHPPGIFGPDKKPLPKGMEVRGGDLVKAILSPIPSDTPVKGSIAWRLLGVQLIEKRAGGGHDVASMFDEEGEGFGEGPATASEGVEAGEAVDDDSMPF